MESLLSSSGFEILENQIWDEKDAVHRVVARKLNGVHRVSRPVSV